MIEILGLISWKAWAIGAAAFAAVFFYFRWKKGIEDRAKMEQKIQNQELDRHVQEAITEAGENAAVSRTDVVDKLRDHKF